MNIVMAIDGACRNNGKPECKSGSGVAILTDLFNNSCTCLMDSECNSTNQRGEMKALLSALNWLKEHALDCDQVQIVTDSEYLFNTMTKSWYISWQNNGWITKSGTEVANKDLWEQIVDTYELLERLDITFYHIKGHVIPIGEVTSLKLLADDKTGSALYQHCLDKYYTLIESKADKIEKAQELSERNNGFRLPGDTFARFVALNCFADVVANVAVNNNR